MVIQTQTDNLFRPFPGRCSDSVPDPLSPAKGPDSQVLEELMDRKEKASYGGVRRRGMPHLSEEKEVGDGVFNLTGFCRD